MARSTTSRFNRDMDRGAGKRRDISRDERMELSRAIQARTKTGTEYHQAQRASQTSTPPPKTGQVQAGERERARAGARQAQQRNAAQASAQQGATTMSAAEKRALDEQRKQAYERARKRRARG